MMIDFRSTMQPYYAKNLLSVQVESANDTKIASIIVYFILLH